VQQAQQQLQQHLAPLDFTQTKLELHLSLCAICVLLDISAQLDQPNFWLTCAALDTTVPKKVPPPPCTAALPDTTSAKLEPSRKTSA